MNFIIWCVFGFFAGLIARAIMPGNDSMGYIMTILLGVAGSFAGGYLAKILFGSSGEPAGFVGAVIGAMVVLFVYRFVKKNSK